MRTWIIGAAMAAMLALPAAAEQPKLPPLPWDQDFALLASTAGELQAGGGMRALGPHVAEFEAALEHGKAFFPNGAVVDGSVYMLADGPGEALIAGLAGMTVAKKAGASQAVVTVPNLYPLFAQALAAYYNENGKPEEAIRVLDAGLLLSVNPRMAAGLQAGGLLSEKAFSLNELKRYDEALAVYDAGLANRMIQKADRARLERGRGFTLTEMNRLDEAADAYRESLKLDPDNPAPSRNCATSKN
jgi:tetratricopeptide (TPR) repeat protein